jgi:thiamine-monophosphate kinase
LGHKALAVSLSDLAAMGAEPCWVLLSISLPGIDQAWLDGFFDGFLKLASEHSVTLVGGDTCSGELSIGVTTMGQVQQGQALTRSGARIGDLVVVSGRLGDAALALSRMHEGQHVGKSGLLALHRPVPRIALGTSLIGKATSCIDISDGLLADLGHVTEASGCGAVVQLAKLPASRELMGCEPEHRWKLQLCGGDDYELCFSIAPNHTHWLRKVSEKLAIELTVVGEIVERHGIRCIDDRGLEFNPDRAGYEHFQ